MAGIQAFDARVQSLAALRRGRLAVVGGRVVARVRGFITHVIGAEKVVVASVRNAEAVPVGAGIDANVRGAEQPVVAIRVGRAMCRRTCLGASDAVQGDETKGRHDKKRRPSPKSV